MHRVLFQVGDYPIYSFGVMVALGVLVGALVSARESHRIGITRDQTLEAAVWIVSVGVLMARLAFVLQDPRFFLTHPTEILHFRAGGMSWHGGIVGLVLGALVPAARFRIKLLDMLDLSAPGMMAGLAVGRIGCLLNGCCFGRPATVPWAVRITDDPTHLLIARHPTPLYEMLGALAVLALLLHGLRHRSFSGETFLGFLFLYSAVRFGVEFFRDGTLLAAGLTLAQYVSILLMAGSGAAWAILRRSAASAPGGTASPLATFRSTSSGG